MNINKNCILRLSAYRNALKHFRLLGFIRVFSDNLAESAGVAASVVRKDFSIFGITGNRKGGYQVDELIKKIEFILGKDKTQKVVLIGCGHIGSALIKYRNFESDGVKIVAGFDIDPVKLKQKERIPILPLKDLAKYIKKHHLKIAIVAVPDFKAQEIADIAIEAGIKGILNFAPITLRVPEGVFLKNVHLKGELENLIYFVNALERDKINA